MSDVTDLITADKAARAQALDLHQSFIVQAPAGSGKTELLTQRLLTLLAHAVTQPEEVVAITFTRKAAAEMRQRILTHLQAAATQPEPTQAHAKLTWQLAQQVLQKDRQAAWQLVQNPQRLKILTIDGFCMQLVQQLPILAKLGGTTAILDDPQVVYRAAARQTLLTLEQEMPWSEAIALLLQHLDQDLAKAEYLLMGMLQRRDQWLPYLGQAKQTQDLRAGLEQALQHVITDTLQQARMAIPADFHQELLIIARFAASHLPADHRYPALAGCSELFDLPAANLTALSNWQGLAQLCLTQDLQWRKRLTLQEGFPAASSTKDKATQALLKSMKQRAMALLQAAENYPKWQEALKAIWCLPPAVYRDEQWQLIESLLAVLPVLVAELQLEFKAHAAVDYLEIAACARQALGTADNPTDLALHLDRRIQHLLIDEFQDTSISQWHLLEQLTAGWMPGDGRTLFLVGDPMQSIYRFRKAEVGIFLRARQLGIGQVRLVPLQLRANFRSQAEVVNWLNQSFPLIFPAVEAISEGAVSYAAAIATRPMTMAAAVNVYPFIGRDDQAEAAQIVSIIQQTLAQQPDASIAILVRARSHLTALLPALQQQQLSYRAVDIVPLFHTPLIQDLLALTQALLHLHDRLAWLALLRAPWCGLSLADLAVIAEDKYALIWERLQHYPQLALSSDAKLRLQRVMPILTARWQQRRRWPLRDWIKGTWLSLGGPACLSHPEQLQDAESFFSLLAQQQQGEEITDFPSLLMALEQLYATPKQTAGIEIMSIHKAKGLEFDCVILPGLGRELPAEEHQLLMWMERTRAQGGEDLLIAPIKASAGQPDSIYDYVRKAEAKKAQYEMARLVYVAATRAKTTLHLLGHANLSVDSLKPAKNSLLAVLWPVVASHFAKLPVSTHTPTLVNQAAGYRRLPADWQLPIASTEDVA